MSKESYQPSEEEIKKAEEMMTEGEKEMSDKREKEGNVADLGSYIKLHKEIALPYNEIIDEELKSKLLLKKSHYVISRMKLKNEISNSIRYITKNGDYAIVNIDTKKIDSLKNIIKEDNKPWMDVNVLMEEELEELGFLKSGELIDDKVNEELFKEKQKDYSNMSNRSLVKTGEHWDGSKKSIYISEERWQNDEEKQFFSKIHEKQYLYERKLEKEMAEKKKEEFDF